MTVLVHLAAETERVLKERAARNGLTLEAFLEEIAVREAGSGAVNPKSTPQDADFERGLDELSEGLPPLPVLPADFSRADI